MKTAPARSEDSSPAKPDSPLSQATEDRSPGMLEVRVTHSSEIDRALEEAIEQVQHAALQHGTGILVTRIGAGRYIVRAHPQVPCGLVRQKYE